MQFNYSLSWHVVVMKEGVLSINRAKLTSQMGFRRGKPAIHLHRKQLSSIWNRINISPPIHSDHPYILNGYLIRTPFSSPTKNRGKSCRNKLLSVGFLQRIYLYCPTSLASKPKPQCNINCKCIFLFKSYNKDVSLKKNR